MRRPVSVTPLYWSNRGEVACASHAPELGSMRWYAEGWKDVPPRSRFFPRRGYQCQHCVASGVTVEASRWIN